MPQLPIREITDPRMLRAMAHPLRLRLLNQLVLAGPATATQLAEALDESPSNCSWHLRQLAQHGLIEESGTGSGRNRPWRWIPTGNRWGGPEDPPELARAGEELTGFLLGFELDQRNRWQESRQEEPEQWREAAFTTQAIAWLTDEELTEIQTTIRQAVLGRSERLSDPATRPEGARPIRFVAWAVPADHPTER